MNSFGKQLCDILTSKNVVQRFYDEYHGEFANWLDDILPEVKLCERQQQRTVWHIYNVFLHILYSVENINKLSEDKGERERLLLSVVMFFHDLGKPKMHFVKMKDGQEQDSFLHHQIESEKIFLRTAFQFDFDKTEIEQICFLIKNHDIFGDFTFDLPKEYETPLTKESVLRFVKSFSTNLDKQKLLKNLCLVARADNLAQNQDVSFQTIKKIEFFEEVLNSDEVKNLI